MALSLDPTTIVANGTDTSSATATLVDCVGPPFFPTVSCNYDTSNTVTFTSTDANEKISTTTNNGDGTYTATITASFAIEQATITSSAPLTGTPPFVFPPASAPATLTQTAGPPTDIVLSISPNKIPADGKATSTLSATVSDGFGHNLSGQTVRFSSTDPGQGISGTTYEGNGDYQATLTASTTPGSSTITTTDTTASPDIAASGKLTETPLPPTAISVKDTPSSIPADGTATSVVTATLTNELGRGVPGQTVVFSSTDPGEKFGAVKDNGDGTYTVTVTASRTAGTATIAASDTAASLRATTTLTETVPVALPFTGFSNWTLAGIASGLLGAGGALLLATRRRMPRFLHSLKR